MDKNKILREKTLYKLAQELLEKHSASCMDDEEEREALANGIVDLIDAVTRVQSVLWQARLSQVQKS